jgi:peptide deformylase
MNTPQNKFALVLATDPILNRIADIVPPKEISSTEIQGIIDFMLNLAAGKGHDPKDTRQMVGLAAPQIGVSKSIVSIDITADGTNKKQTLQIIINPIITHRSEETVLGREGCWSCGNICGKVERAKEVTLEGLDRDGNPVKLELTDFVARIAQHEADHLEGIRFPDRIPIDQPDNLLWVEAAEFENYRKNWATWPTLYPRERWEEMKAGN